MPEAKWADTAPEYKKQGKMYARVEYDHEGQPQFIHVGQDQVRRGEFKMKGTTAVYKPHHLPTLSEAGEEVKEYVKAFPFVEEVIL
jgi:hypothetical protein